MSFAVVLTWDQRIFRTPGFKTRALAAAAVPRLLGKASWDNRLRTVDGVTGTFRIVESDEPASSQAPWDGPMDGFSEEKRRAVYEAVKRDIWQPTDDEAVPPPYSPEAAGLAIHYIGGRWLASWTRLDVVEGTEEDRHEVVRIYCEDGELIYSDV
jgi:hypothetical protein